LVIHVFPPFDSWPWIVRIVAAQTGFRVVEFRMFSHLLADFAGLGELWEPIGPVDLFGVAVLAGCA
jgi:hypothetical protein